MELLDKFQACTVSTISTDQVRSICQTSMIKLACSMRISQSSQTCHTNRDRPSMHAVLMLTLMHHRPLSTIPSETVHHQRLPLEPKHALFNSNISWTIEQTARNALWATTIVQATIAFYDANAEMPEEAWPLRPDSPWKEGNLQTQPAFAGPQCLADIGAQLSGFPTCFPYDPYNEPAGGSSS